jgi:hypothetical protein
MAIMRLGLAFTETIGPAGSRLLLQFCEPAGGGGGGDYQPAQSGNDLADNARSTAAST